MSLDSAITIVRQVEDNTYDAAGKRSAFVRVEYMVGSDGPFVERIPKDQYTADERDRKLNDFARHVARR